MCWRGRGLGRYDFMLTYSWLFGSGGGAGGGHGVRGVCCRAERGEHHTLLGREGFVILSGLRGVQEGIIPFAASPFPRPIFLAQ